MEQRQFGCGSGVSGWLHHPGIALLRNGMVDVSAATEDPHDGAYSVSWFLVFQIIRITHGLMEV